MAEAPSNESPIPVHGANGIIGWTGKTLYTHGVPLVTCRGSNCGMVLWANGPLWVSNNAMAILPDGSLDLRFLYYNLLYSPPYEFVSGSAQPQITIGDLSKKKFTLPPLPEQRAIAATLGALDDKIELNRKMNATLEAMARTLFRDWFVDFGPTRAKMAQAAQGGETENTPHAPYLSPDLWSLFPDRLDAEGKPEGWEVGTVGDLVTFNPKEALRKYSLAPYLDMAALPTHGANHSAPIHRPFASGSKFRDGDSLMARITPCLENGKTCLVHGLGDGTVGWGSTEFIVMRPKPPLPTAFAYLLARDQDFRDAAIRSMSGTSGRQRATVESIANRAFAVPPQQVVLAFGECVNVLFQRVSHNERESRTLAQTRDLLLPRLMSGELRVAGAECVLERGM